MSKWDIEMAYGVNVSVEVEADTREEALHEAKQEVEKRVELINEGKEIEVGDLEFSEITFVSEN